MATWISASGNNKFSQSNSWLSTDSVGDQLFGNTSLLTTTTIQFSSNVALGVNTINGVMLQLSSISAGIPFGTVSVQLRNTTLNTTLAQTTVNASDFNFPYGNGWYYFGFQTPVASVGATNYAVGVSSSIASTVGFFRNGVANNWNTAYVTSGTGNPTSGDNIFIVSEMTGQGVWQTSTITNDSGSGSTSANQYNSINVSPSSSLIYLTTTTSNLSCSGTTNVWGYGKWEMGNAGTPVSATVSACLTLTCSANNSAPFIAQAGSIINMYGAPLLTRTLLTSDFVNPFPTMTVADNVGWRVGDAFVIGGTASLKSARYFVSLTGAGSITATQSAINGHSGSAYSSYVGTFDARADVFNLSRNVYISVSSLSASSSASTVQLGNCLSANIYYTEFAGVAMNLTQSSGTSNVFFNSFHDVYANFPFAGNPSAIMVLTGNCTNLTISGNFIYNGSSLLAGIVFNNTSQLGNAPYPIVNSNIFCKGLGSLVTMNSASAVFCNNVINDSTTNGLSWNTARPLLWNNLSGLVVYGVANGGIAPQSFISASDVTLTAFQLSYARIYCCQNFLVAPNAEWTNSVFTSCTGFSNTIFHINVQGNPLNQFIFVNGLFTSRIPSKVFPTKTQAFFGAGIIQATFINTVIGVSGTNFAGYNTGAVGQSEFFSASQNNLTQIVCYSCSSEFVMSVMTPALYNNYFMLLNNYTPPNCYSSFQDHQGLTGNNFSFVKGGFIKRNTLSAQAGSTECVQMTPASTPIGVSNIPLRQTYFIPVQANTARSVTATMMVDSSYTGAQSYNPQLTLNFLGQAVANNSYVLSANPNSYSACVINIPNTVSNENGGLNLFVDAFGSSGNLYIQSVTWA